MENSEIAKIKNEVFLLEKKKEYLLSKIEGNTNFDEVVKLQREYMNIDIRINAELNIVSDIWNKTKIENYEIVLNKN